MHAEGLSCCWDSFLAAAECRKHLQLLLMLHSEGLSGLSGLDKTGAYQPPQFTACFGLSKQQGKPAGPRLARFCPLQQQ